MDVFNSTLLFTIFTLYDLIFISSSISYNNNGYIPILQTPNIRSKAQRWIQLSSYQIDTLPWARPVVGQKTTGPIPKMSNLNWARSSRTKKPSPIIGPTPKVGPFRFPFFSIFPSNRRSKGFIPKNQITKERFY